MASRNPAIDPPRFVPPVQVYRSASPSPSPSRSASPSRHSRNFSQSHDPLARDLSPTRTLRAFTSAPGSAESTSDAALVRLIEKASSSERAFGVRIAQTCKDIRTWHNELQQWPWQESFEAPPDAADAVEGPYFGSLRQNQVVAYEQRVHDIGEALFEQDVDGLKDYVLSQHTHPKSADYEHLGDFTALITATILRALPDLSRLDRLLNTWSIRLAVLRKVPGYIKGLDQARRELDRAWTEMARTLHDTHDAVALRQAFQAAQEQVESRMGKVGGRLDSMLDDLEGREETLPDAWIDSFESLEANYTDWLTQTERQIIGQTRTPPLPHISRSTPTDLAAPEIGPAAAAAAAESSDGHVAPGPKAGADPSVGASDPRQLAESPILGTSSAAFLPDVDEASDFESDSVSRDLKKVPATSASVPTALHRAGSLKSLSPSVSRSRHVPIFAKCEEKAQDAPPSGSPVIAPESPSTDQLPLASDNKVRTRAAFLNGGIEQTQSLQKSVSPVRPFEHASMAFTKLFNKANAAGANRSRSSSTSSRSSARKGLGLGIKNHEGFRHFHRSTSVSTPNKSAKENERNSTTASSPPPPTQSFSPDQDQNATASSVFGPEHSGVSRKGDDSARPSAQAAYVTPEIQQDYFPSTQESNSTIDTNWTSPALSDFPENWPLPVRVFGEEISTPKDAVASDMFEKMFVDSLPGTPHAKARRQSQEDNPFERALTRPRSKRSKEPLLDDSMLSGPARHRSHSSSSSGSSRPRHVSRPSTTSLSFQPISELPTPGSFDATPELRDASAAGYFQAKKIQSSPETMRSPSIRRNASQAKWSSEEGARDEARPSPMSFNLNPPVSEDAEANEASYDERDDQSFTKPRPMIKRASVTSIENHSRSELNTIEIPDVPRRASLSSAPIFGGPLPEPFRRRVSSHSRTGSAPAVTTEFPPPTLRSDTERSYTANMLGASKPTPLDLNVHKRRIVVDKEIPSSSTNSKSNTLQTDHTKKKHMRKESGAEQLDRHVSRVLNALPSRIAFKPSLAAATLDPSSASSIPSGPARPRPSLSSKPSRTDLTLSAVQDPKKSPVADSDVKLYHLTQEGRDQPIKLFVRLVGDGERVMVRVGGGWADLGEYLRHYAEHHGHRTFSDGKLEVAAAAASGGSMRVGGGAKTRTPLSRPGSVMDRPESSMSFRTGRSSFGANTLPDDTNSSPSSSSQNIDITPTHARNGYNTPTGSVKSSSRPSTADTFLHASPSSWSGKEIGLAGPSSKRGGGLDEQKARWVEEMIGRAKQASAEKKKNDERAAVWADMGKVGGTRRIVFKHKHSDNGSGSS